MQQVIDKRFAPAYIGKITLYFVPDGMVDIQIGNQRFHARPEDVETLIRNQLTLHTQNAALFESVNGNTHATMG